MNHDFGSHFFFQRDPYVWWEESKTPTAQVEAGAGAGEEAAKDEKGQRRGGNNTDALNHHRSIHTLAWSRTDTY